MNEDLPEKLRRIETKIDSLKKMLQQCTTPANTEEANRTKTFVFYPAEKEAAANQGPPINVYMLKLPDSLRKTMLAMSWLREATTSQVAKITERTRSVESFHLNQLERMGYLVKLRRGKKIYFRVPKPFEAEGRKFAEVDR